MSVSIVAAPLVVLFLAAVCLVWAAASDAAHYKIPNSACLVLFVLFPLFSFVAPTSVNWMQSLIVFASILSVGFFLFAKNWMGAGDIKLMAVLGLWSGVSLLPIFLVLTAFAGGLLSCLKILIVYVQNRKARNKGSASVRKILIPYGIAIAIGGLAVLMELSRPLLSSLGSSLS